MHGKNRNSSIVVGRENKFRQHRTSLPGRHFQQHQQEIPVVQETHGEVGRVQYGFQAVTDQTFEWHLGPNLHNTPQHLTLPLASHVTERRPRERQ